MSLSYLLNFPYYILLSVTYYVQFGGKAAMYLTEIFMQHQHKEK